MKEKLGLIKKAFSKNENNKKQIENLVIFLIILIITVIAINVIWSDDEEKPTDTNANKDLVLLENDTVYEDDFEDNELENKLENILSNLAGAGKVKVLLTYTQSSEVVVLYNENVNESVTQETDSSGGVRTIEAKDNSKEVVFKNENGEEVPITKKVVMPQIQGAVVLAEGAGNAEIKNNIILAVEAVTGLSSHKIQVFQLNNN